MVLSSLVMFIATIDVARRINLVVPYMDEYLLANSSKIYEPDFNSKISFNYLESFRKYINNNCTNNNQECFPSIQNDLATILSNPCYYNHSINNCYELLSKNNENVVELFADQINVELVIIFNFINLGFFVFMNSLLGIISYNFCCNSCYCCNKWSFNRNISGEFSHWWSTIYIIFTVLGFLIGVIMLFCLIFYLPVINFSSAVYLNDLKHILNSYVKILHTDFNQIKVHTKLFDNSCNNLVVDTNYLIKGCETRVCCIDDKISYTTAGRELVPYLHNYFSEINNKFDSEINYINSLTDALLWFPIVSIVECIFYLLCFCLILCFVANKRACKKFMSCNDCIYCKKFMSCSNFNCFNFNCFSKKPVQQKIQLPEPESTSRVIIPTYIDSIKQEIPPISTDDFVL